MLRFAALTLILCSVSLTVSAQGTRYAEVRIEIPDGASVASVIDGHGVDIGHFRMEETEAGIFIRTVLPEREWQRARSSGLNVSVLDPDLGQTLANRPPFTDAQREAARQGGRIEGNVLGSLQGHPTFDEVVDILDDMHLQFPDLIS
ncbi:MAG: hypothetical protein R3284_12125, partial [Rubricoccaceae bacterium]|nr:hypothetical protein [Rubricoccaceae bacterium]